MKNIRVFLSENFQLLEVKCSILLNRRVFVMNQQDTTWKKASHRAAARRLAQKKKKKKKKKKKNKNHLLRTGSSK